MTISLNISYLNLQAGLSLAKPVAPGNAGENQDQPSPISVLEPPFVEDDNTIQEFSRFLKPDHLGNLSPFIFINFFLLYISFFVRSY